MTDDNHITLGTHCTRLWSWQAFVAWSNIFMHLTQLAVWKSLKVSYFFLFYKQRKQPAVFLDCWMRESLVICHCRAYTYKGKEINSGKSEVFLERFSQAQYMGWNGIKYWDSYCDQYWILSHKKLITVVRYRKSRKFPMHNFIVLYNWKQRWLFFFFLIEMFP